MVIMCKHDLKERKYTKNHYAAFHQFVSFFFTIGVDFIVKEKYCYCSNTNLPLK